MTVHVRSIETAVPPAVLQQSDFRDLFAGQPDVSRLGRRLIGAVFDASAIGTRHTVVDELESGHVPPASPVFHDAGSGTILRPSTGTRNAVYAARAPELFRTAAERALEAAGGLAAADVTHLVTVSCTGFYAPGPDYGLVCDLGLDPGTQRYHLGFMGCCAAFPALRAAEAFCRADPDAVVLVVCAELCTIHLQSSDHADQILASSVFADGAAAAVVTARPAPDGLDVLELDAFSTALVPEGEADMAWTIADSGFEMTLSSDVPKIIERHIRDALNPLVGSTPYPAIERWAVHPGGRSILDRVQRSLGLGDEQLEPSREVLREYGNMSSATVLFVLRRILHKGSAEPERVCAMAFGPGLTVETALLTRRPGA